MGHVKYQLIGFWCSDSILRPFLISDDTGGRYLQILYDLRKSKYEINENKSCEVSNHRYFGFPIPF